MTTGDDEPPQAGSTTAEKTPPGADRSATPHPPHWRWNATFRAVSGFASNTVVARRFRILRLIGTGGMGEVYEAEDLELRERVALKTVRPEIADEERVMERFRREIQLARRVTHPSVCRSFDVFRHRLEAPAGWEGPTPEVTFLSMELLEGETLAERIRSKGPLTMEEALPIIEQVAAGLAAAHDAGVVHRDFKSSNVVLVPAKLEGAIRAVVTDFGLARSGTSRADESGSASGGLAGTLAYMAPEQVEGGAITPATDVYGLGVVMYEMITGKWPFEGETPLAMAIKRLNEKPISPRARAPRLDPVWDTAILRCLERDPADRFASPLDLLKALAGEEVTAGPGQQRRRRRSLVAAASLLLLFIGASLWWLRTRPTAVEPTPPAGISTRRAVAVLGFKNLSGREDAAWLTKALSEMLTMELAAGETLRIIPGESVARVKVDLALPETDSLAPDTLGKIRKNLGTDLVVLGSYFAAGKDSGSRLRLDLRIQDTASGETLATVSDDGTEGEILALVSKVGSQLREKLGVGQPAPAAPEGARASLPSTPEAARLYSEGVAKLRLFDALAARDLLQKATSADPKYALAHSALAEAFAALGYDERAREESRKAADLSAPLSREERLSVEGRYHEHAKEWGKAIETYRTLWGFFPDNLGYGLRLAEAQAGAGKGADGMATIATLRRLPPPASEDPRIDLTEAAIAESLGSLKLQRAAARTAAEKGLAQGARLLVARARLLEAGACRYLGEWPRALAASDEAKAIYLAAGDRFGVARALVRGADVVRYQGDLAGARRMAEEALALSREIGDRTEAANALNRIAGVLSEQGSLREAQKMYEESLALWREIGQKSWAGTATNNVGTTLWKQGELPAARKTLEQSLAIFREIGDKRGIAFAFFNLGFVLRDAGDLAGARKRFEEALAQSRAIEERSLAAVSLAGLGALLLDEGDVAAARKRHEEALALRRDLGEKGRLAESSLALAALAMEEGRPAEAEALARPALEEFQREKTNPSEALAQAVLADALLAQKKLPEARRAVDRAQVLSDGSEYRSVRMRVVLTVARERVASARPAEAVRILNAILSEANQHGLRRLQLEARLALGEIEQRFGDSQSGWTSLAVLESDAKASGFNLIARKAKQLRP